MLRCFIATFSELQEMNKNCARYIHKVPRTPYLVVVAALNEAIKHKKIGKVFLIILFSLAHYHHKVISVNKSRK